MAKRNKIEQMNLNEKLFEVLSFPEASSEEVLELLNKGADPTSTVEAFEDESAICLAAEIQPAEIVKLLLDNCNYDVNQGVDDESGPDAPIYCATENPDIRVFPMLINEYNADCPLYGDFNPITRICFKYWERTKSDSDNPFESAEDLYCYLSEACHIDDQNIFWNAVLGNCLDLCKYMKQEKEISLDMERDDGESAIHLASKCSVDAEVLKWLVEDEGVSPETESSTGMRPIHFASQGMFPAVEAIDYLVKCCKVDTNVQSGEGLYPIYYVCRDSVVEWALKDCIEEYNYDYTLEDADGWIPLDYTIYNKHVEATKYLVALFGKEGVRKAYKIAFAFNELEFVRFLSEDCGFDLKKEKWVEVYEYEDEERKWEPTTMKRLLYNNNAEIYKYCFEKHYGKKLPKVDSIPFADIYSTRACSIIDYLLSRYNPKTYLDCLVEDGYQSPWGAFCEAARLNDIGLLKYLVEKKKVTLEDCSHSDGNLGNEPLFPIHAAIKNGNLEMVKYLVEECHANPVESSLNNGSTILFAAQENQMEIADYLIEKARDRGIDACYSVVLAYIEDRKYKEALNCIEKYDINVDDLFCSFCVNRNKNTVIFLKKVYAKYDIDLSYEDDDGNTALVNSLLYGSFGIFKWLVEDCGQKPGEVMVEGRSALILAARAENPDLIRYLVEKCNLDVNSKDSKGNSAIIYAINGRNFSAEENCEIIHYLVKHGADINSQDSDKENILHYIARNSFYDIEEFEQFIEEGADFMVKNRGLKTPLHIAAEAGRLDIVQSLIENHNVDPNIQCRDKATSAHLAARSNQTEIVEWLIENGYTKVNRKDKDGNSILRYAVFGFCNSVFNDDESHLELVRWLVENGADCNSMNSDGITPLHEAAEQGNLIAVKYFIEECGMNPSIGKDEYFGTPAEYAKGERAVVRYLHKKEKEWEARHAN